MAKIVIGSLYFDEDKIELYSRWLRRANIIPQIEDPKNLGQNPPVMIDKYTLKQWAMTFAHRGLVNEIREGRRLESIDSLDDFDESGLSTEE